MEGWLEVSNDRGDYFRCGLRLLAESGVGGLTIAALCAELGVTKGSFYHHFDGMPAYVTALLEHWENEHSRGLIARSATEGDPVRRERTLIEFAVALPHGAEAALRGWGRSSAEVARVLARVDAEREDHVTASTVELGVPRERARLLAATAMAVLIGEQARSRPVDVERLRAMLGELLDHVIGELG